MLKNNFNLEDIIQNGLFVNANDYIILISLSSLAFEQNILIGPYAKINVNRVPFTLLINLKIE